MIIKGFPFEYSRNTSQVSRADTERLETIISLHIKLMLSIYWYIQRKNPSRFVLQWYDGSWLIKVESKTENGLKIVNCIFTYGIFLFCFWYDLNCKLYGEVEFIDETHWHTHDAKTLKTTGNLINSLLMMN